ncbi:MAG: pilus assembly protein PilM [Pseudomonadota bacterium]|nr:pilus assembly protein PilM [Pseudomonadota bacterium]
MGLLSRTPPPLVGIDISTTAVKLLGLSAVGDKYRIDSYAVVPLPPDSMAEKNIVAVDKVGEAIQRAVQRGKVKAKHAAVAVSGSSVITKVITMPADLPDADLESQITLEADQYIPYSLDEVYLDFQVIGPTANNPETVDVLLAASRSDTVDQRVDALEAGGMTANVVDIEAYAIETAFELIAHQAPQGGRGKTIAIIDVGATATTLNILHDGKSIFTREQMFGGKQLTEEIQHRYGLSTEDAGRLKKTGELPDGYETEVLEPFKSLLAQQVSRLLQIFFSSANESQIDQIILCGGSAAIQDVDQVVEANIGVPTVVANPLQNMTIGSGLNGDAIRRDATSLMIACGLALRTFDHAAR